MSPSHRKPTTPSFTLPGLDPGTHAAPSLALINKITPDLGDAVAGIHDGATILVSGFGEAGMPTELLAGVADTGARDLTIVSNNAGVGRTGIAALMELGRVRRIVCSFPRSVGSVVFEKCYAAGGLELEVVPQGTLSERIRAGGAGIGAFYVKTGVGTLLAAGKETREIRGDTYVLEYPIHADVALIKADTGDRWGNLTYHKAARNFGPVMAPAAALTIVQVRRVVELGAIDPEHVVTPGVFVDRVWECPTQ